MQTFALVFERILAIFELPKLDIPECRPNVELMTTFDQQIFPVLGQNRPFGSGSRANLQRRQELWLPIASFAPV